MSNLKNCPQCGSNQNVTISDHGYSSFNIGYAKCSCGFEVKLDPCSCFPEEEIKKHWNHYIDFIDQIKGLSKEELQKIILSFTQKDFNKTYEIVNQTLFPKKNIVCLKCAGHGEIITIQGFHKTKSKCKICNGKGFLEESL